MTDTTFKYLATIKALELTQLELIREILSGGYDLRELSHCFLWQDTPEGIKFWSDAHYATELSDEARIALREILQEYEAYQEIKT